MAQIDVLDLIGPVAQRTRGCPTPTLVTAYVDACRKFCIKSRWLRKAITGATAASTRLYSLGSDPYNEIIGVKAIEITYSSTDHYNLISSDSGMWNPDTTLTKPRYYQYVPEAQFAINPTPTAIYPLTVSIAVAPKRGVNSIEEILPVQWEYVLREGAWAELFAIPGMPWSNDNLAMAHGRMFEDGCNQATSQEQRAYNTGAAVSQRLRVKQT